MLDKRQKEVIIPYLKEDGLMDGEVKMGFVFVDRNHRDNSEELQYNKVVELGKEYEGCRLCYFVPDFAPCILMNKRLDFLRNERVGYRKTGRNEGEKRYEMIGQYSLGSIFEWCMCNHVMFGHENYKGKQRLYLYNNEVGEKRAYINIETKPPMERTEEQNRILAEFMQKAKGKTQ